MNKFSANITQKVSVIYPWRIRNRHVIIWSSPSSSSRSYDDNDKENGKTIVVNK